jgi:hypothetical protein
MVSVAKRANQRKKMTTKMKMSKKKIQPAIYSDADVDGARNCLLHSLRSTGSGLGVLALDNKAFTDMVVNDENYRAMLVEILKSMFAQMGFDETCAALAGKAREKIIAALVASNDSSVMDALKKPVDFSLIPQMGAINLDHLNGLQPAWKGDVVLQ